MRLFHANSDKSGGADRGQRGALKRWVGKFMSTFSMLQNTLKLSLHHVVAQVCYLLTRMPAQ